MHDEERIREEEEEEEEEEDATMGKCTAQSVNFQGEEFGEETTEQGGRCNTTRQETVPINRTENREEAEK